MIDYTQHSTNIPFDIECLTYRVLKVNELELYSPNDLDVKGDRKLATRLYVQKRFVCPRETNMRKRKKDTLVLFWKA